MLPSILTISGSLRRQSYNGTILRTLAERVADRAHLKPFPLDGVPFYNQDLEPDALPDPVRDLRAEIDLADGLLIATPEYNHGVPGVLKNALDWASRPYGASTLTGKHVLTLTSSVAYTGGVRAHSQLNETLISIGVRLVIRPQLVIGLVHEKIEGDKLTDRVAMTQLVTAIDDLLRDIRHVGRARQEA